MPTKVRFEHDGGTYEFQRGFGGEGRWVCLAGKCIGVIGRHSPGIVVPLMHGHDLSNLAVESGIAKREDLARFIAKPEPEPKQKRERTGRKTTRRKDGVISGISLANLLGG